MTLGPMLGYVALFYAILHALDVGLRHWTPLRYLQALHFLGLQISPLQLRFMTERFNRGITRFGSQCPGLLRAWFCLGSLVSTLLILPSIYLLLKTLVEQLGSSSATEDRLVIQPVLPGVNIPSSELGYYFLSLLICSVYHELGHAVAAVTENVRVLGFGVFLLFIIPAAHVDLPAEQLITKSLHQKLRLFSAGVWHNLILVAVAYAVLLLLPYPLAPLYSHQEGVCVTEVIPDSPVRGPSGLQSGDVIVSINGRPVLSKENFRQGILSALQEAAHGYCVPNSTLPLLGLVTGPPGPADCCPAAAGGQHLCFTASISATDAFFCLPARDLVTSTNVTCGGPSLVVCPLPENTCLVPYFGPTAGNISSSSSTKLVRVGRRGDSARDFLFVGNPVAIYTAVVLSDFCPRYGLVPGWLPDSLLRLARYIASFSGALAVLNVVPCYMLDGQHMMDALLELAMQGSCAVRRRRLQTTVTLVGSGLVLANIAAGFVSLAKEGPPHHF